MEAIPKRRRETSPSARMQLKSSMALELLLPEVGSLKEMWLFQWFEDGRSGRMARGSQGWVIGNAGRATDVDMEIE